MRPAMPVPAAIRKTDDPYAHLNQPAGGEEIVVEQGARVAIPRILGRAAAVAVAQLRVFALQIERFGQLARGENAQGLLLVGVEAGDVVVGFGRAAEAVEPL